MNINKKINLIGKALTLTWTTLQRSAGERKPKRASKTGERSISQTCLTMSQISFPSMEVLMVLTTLLLTGLLGTSTCLADLEPLRSLSTAGFCLKRGERLFGTAPRLEAPTRALELVLVSSLVSCPPPS